MGSILNTPQVDRLATLVEEATRATTGAPGQFIEPARGTLDRAKARRHHIVFGRRGSGKTSLLGKAKKDLSRDRRPTAFVDLETFKGHSYPDVLLSILIATFRAFDTWLVEAGLNPTNKVSFWKRLGGKPNRPPFNKRRVKEIGQTLKNQIEDLEAQLHSSDDAALKTTTTRESQSRRGGQLGVKVGTGTAGVSAGAGAQKQVALSQCQSEESRRSKIGFLHRHIMDYQSLFEEIVALAGGNCFVFLDDLYHIRRSDQPQVIDYFHRIAKGKGVWLKIGTIRHRTEWYRHGDPPIGMKLGDDCDEIDLDITLEKYAIAKDFLFKVLGNLIDESGLNSYRSILADGGVERLVLASGGVVRDFLTIFRRSIAVGRERLQRGSKSRGDRIGAEDVNNAAGEHDTSKRDELRRDTAEERDALESAFGSVRNFCWDKKANCLLVERDRDTEGMRIIGELVDLRLLHLVASRLTVSGRAGKLYIAYMLDVSQYTGDRKRRDLELIPFWTKIDRVRRAGLIFDPDDAFSNIISM